MQFSLKGYLNSTPLAPSKALWPLFEAVVNSIQAIENSNNKSCGKIQISAQREPAFQALTEKKETLGRFEQFTITDNGEGFTKENYKSFQTACSTLKVKKGCKGLGRFTWLKAFDQVDISSIYSENNVFFNRSFSFTADEEVSPAGDTPLKVDPQEYRTTVTLKGFIGTYKNAAPVELDVVAKKIIEHCLPFFISDQCPEITICDGVSPSISLNSYFKANIKDSLHQDHFTIKGESFTIYHIQIPEGVSTHKLHLCANMQEVDSVDLKNYIPDLHRKIYPENNPLGFYYVGYVTGSYLDSVVNQARTAFEFDEKDKQITIYGTGKETIISTATEFIKAYLKDYINEIKKKKHEQIDSFVSSRRPTYRYMLHINPDIYDVIPAGLNEADLEMELHKQQLAWESAIFQQGKMLEANAAEAASSGATYKQLFDEYWTGITALSKTCLAEYIVRRKAILTILENALEIQDNGRFKKEEVIHSLICPMQHTSDDVSFEEMNLWIIDERLAYHKYLASDKTLKSMPIVDSNRIKEPDIAVFDRAFAYSDSDEPLTTVTIVEFKKPDNDAKNPINQVGEYIDLIRDGHKKKANGQSFSVSEGTLFRCYVICDLTRKMRQHCVNNNLIPTADNLGFTGYNQVRHAYYEVISYKKLLLDAKKRNQIFFDKLFTPKIDEVIHISSDED